MMHNLAIIVCCDKFGGIALNKQIPWLNDEFTKDDLQNFKNITNSNICVMGRHTYNEILFHRKQSAKDPLAHIDTLLPGRLSYVLTRNPDQYPNLEGVHVEKYLRKVYDKNADTLLHQNKRIFIIII